MNKYRVALLMLILAVGAIHAAGGNSDFTPNRAPLKSKPYSELPLGAIKPQGWLRHQLQIMADGMTGHLDELYPEVCGDRNAWLGGDGDCWERGPYWIDGLYPLSVMLDDPPLKAKVKPWIEWTLTNQRPNGQIGPYGIKKEDRRRPAPEGAQVIKPDDWWPRMVMLKILQQHYMATGDERVIGCMTNYFRYQLKELPKRPLYDPNNPNSGSWWAQQRGGDNLMVVYWLYNITGDKFLLELGDLIYKQTLPFTDQFLSREVIRQKRYEGDQAYHCVNLGQAMKTPAIRYQADKDEKHLEAIGAAFEDIRKYHGQPHGLFGGDEGMHGRDLTRGSEFCTTTEMLFSLEKMLEITGDLDFADRIERIAYNLMPTQASDDFMTRQYFQQANQISCTHGDRDFHNDNGDRVVYGLTSGYPCCTCNMHQGWPKLVQHLWMASADGGLAALVYGPSEVTAKVAGGQTVTITEATRYPMADAVNLTVKTDGPVKFPLHLRIPAWCENPTLKVNGKEMELPMPGNTAVVNRQWENGDTVHLILSAPFRTERWHENSASLYRGPLLFALKMDEEWSECEDPKTPGKINREARSSRPWNYALIEQHLQNPEQHFKLERADMVADYFWNLENAPLKVIAQGVRDPEWQLYKQDTGPIPWSPRKKPDISKQEEIELVPYGCTTLRISAFPTFNVKSDKKGAAKNAVYNYAGASASYTCPSDDVDAVRRVRKLTSSSKPVPRWTSWPQTGKQQWLEIDLGETKEIQSVGVYWYDDSKGIRLPAAWHLEAFAGGWKKIKISGEYGVLKDGHNTVHPARPLQADKIRFSMAPLNRNSCIGILSVNIETAAVAGVAPKKKDNRPNFVFFITDDISPDDLGPYGNKVVQTPNLDRIARQGLVFDNAYNVISSCSPSRCAIITGRYPHNTGAPELHTTLPEGQRTFVQALQRAGYHTVLSGKNHMAAAAQLGFDVESDSKPAGSENWVAHLRDRPKDRPFFCWFASHDAHFPWQHDDKAPEYNPADVPVPPMMFDGPLTRKELTGYYHEVSRTDHYAGEIMKELEAQGIADNTYFIYCADNGRPFPRCKSYMYQSGIQTPLIIAGPGVAKGRTESLTSSIDYAATILELAGLEKPETVQGTSLVPILGNPAAAVRDVAFAERNWHVYQLHERAVRHGDWLYIWNAWPNRYNVCGESSSFDLFPAARELWEAAEQGKLTDALKLLTLPEQPQEMLFNINRDPYQFTNLADSPEQAKVLGQMRGLLAEWKKQTGDCVQKNPTPSRQPLHEESKSKVMYGDFPGAVNNATEINRSGPVLLQEK